MATKIKLHNGQWVRRELHKPCLKVAKAAARFVKYSGSDLTMSFRQGYRLAGQAFGSHFYKVMPPDHGGGVYDPLHRAIHFFEVCAHETCHCQDSIEGRWFYASSKRWQDKPCEIAVFNRLYDLTDGTAKHYAGASWVTEVKLPKYVQDAILELALVLDDVLDYPEGCSTIA